MTRSFFKYLFTIVFSIYISIVIAETKDHFKNWNSVYIIGPLSAADRFKYYVEPQLRLLDDKYKFNEFYVYLGLGVQVTPHMDLWLMNGWFDIKSSNGRTVYEDTIRQQLSWQVPTLKPLILFAIFRLEERKHSSEKRWAVRTSEKFTLRIPFTHWEHHAFVLSDEVFFNLNHPKWINSNTFFEQNRSFIGIGTNINKQISFDIGYLNQYQMLKSDEMSNVLYVACYINLI